jgi:hypothetical protein
MYMIQKWTMVILLMAGCGSTSTSVRQTPPMTAEQQQAAADRRAQAWRGFFNDVAEIKQQEYENSRPVQRRKIVCRDGYVAGERICEER